MKHLLAALALFALLSPTFALEDTEWAQMKEAALNRQRRLIYDNDGDDMMWAPDDKDMSVEKFLAQRITCTAGVVDTIV